MRIAIVSTPFVAVPPPGYGGTELVVHGLAQALVRGGHQVVVYATADSRLPGAQVKALFDAPVWPPEPYAELAHAHFAARDLTRHPVDVIHAHVPAFLPFAHDLDAPVVYTVHHARDLVLARFYANAPRARRVAISSRQAALAAVPMHHVVHHGLDPDLYPLAGPGGEDAFFLGRLSWCKGPELAIDAARLAGVRIVVAGMAHGDEAPPGWREDVLAPALARAHVHCVSEADLAAKRRIFARSRALLVPSRWEEPFGLVTIEAMLAGCPVIGFPRGAAPELIEDGVTGILVDDVPEMAAALGRVRGIDRARCRARARDRFSSERMAEEYLAVYRVAIAARARAPAGPPAGGDGEWTTLAQ